MAEPVTVEGKIPDLLLKKLNAVGFMTGVQRSLPGINFTPPNQGYYLEARFLPNRNNNFGLSNDSPTQRLGIFQVAVCFPTGTGIIEPTEIAAQIVSHFDKDTKLYAGDVCVKIYEKPSVAPSIQDGTWDKYPVSIRYTVSA
jgi:hypothetical protein